MRRHWIVAALATILLIFILVLDVLIDEPLRRWVAREANDRVKGYTIHITHADFKPWILSAKLRDVEILQDAHPETPVAHLAEAAVDVDWQALFSGRLVADLVLIQPVLHIDTVQLREEWNDRVPLKDRGWQLVWEIYPLKVNRFTIVDGSVDYVDTESERSLKLEQLRVHASNIRHVTGRGVIYPSPVEAEAVLFDSGRLSLAGHANFLLRPHPGFNVVAAIEGLPLGSLGPIVADYHVKLSKGSLSARGQFEVAPDRYIANLERLDVADLRVDYIAGAETPEIARVRRGVAEAARYADRSPAVRLRARQLNVSGDFGYVSETQPRYRVFLDKAKLAIRNFSNRAEQGESNLSLDGLFMDSGRARVRGVLRPGKGPTNFALNAEVVATDLPRLNDLLRAHGKFDVSAGTMSVYTQFHVKDGRVRGYVKPVFSDIEVYDAEDDRDKNVFRKLYEKIVEGISKILENPEREEVVTIVDISGPLEDPRTSTLQVIGNLLRNAFIRAILPGFDQERERAGQEAAKPQPESAKPKPEAAKPKAGAEPAPAPRAKTRARYAAEPAVISPGA